MNINMELRARKEQFMAALLCIHSAKQVNNNRNLTISIRWYIFYLFIYLKEINDDYVHPLHIFHHLQNCDLA